MDKDNQKSKFNPKLLCRILAVAISILILTIIVWIILWLVNRQQEQTISTTPDFPACLEENLPAASARSLADDVNVSSCVVYSQSQDVEQYINAFIDYLQSTKLSPSTQAELYSALAKNLYDYRAALMESGIENHEYDSRIIAYIKQADTLNPTAMSARLVLDYATTIGDDAVASEYQAIYDSRNANNEETNPNVQVAG